MAPVDNILERGREKEFLGLARLSVELGLSLGYRRLVALQVSLLQRESTVDLERLINQLTKLFLIFVAPLFF